MVEGSEVMHPPGPQAMIGPLDAVVFHIHRAGLLIRANSEGLPGSVGDELAQARTRLDGAIRQLRRVALDSNSR